MNNDMNNDMNNNNFNNLEQNDYYNNDSYYSNNNYDNNYSDTSYEEKEKNNGMWWKILVVILILLIIILLLLKFCGGGNGSSQDNDYAQLTARVCNAAETYVANNPNVLDRTEPGRTAIIKFQTLANANLIESQIKNPYYDGGLFKKENQPKYYSMETSVRLSVLADGTLNCEIVDNSMDETAPELRLNGDVEISFAVGTEYEDPGYVATDDYDGDITNKVVISGSVNSAKAGEYELTYTVQDSAGNVTTKKRKVIYNNYSDIEVTLGSVLDGVTPQISLKGANPYCLVKGTKFIEPGASATDNVDGNITDRISVSGNVTGNLMGSFRLVYKVEDSSGNQAIAYRAVVVTTKCPSQNEPEKVVNTAPTLSLVGKTSVTINIGTEYIDLGATAYDKEDGDITSKIVTDTTNVKVNAAGIYKVIYRVTDSGGLTSTITRTVTVKEVTASNPVVRFTEDKSNVEVMVGKGSNSLITAPKAVNENGVQVAVTSKIEDYVTKESVSQIDWNVAGKYRVIYTAVHGNGTLQQTKTIVVTIINDSVTIGGKDAINVILRKENCDITEADLIAGGVTFTTASNSTPVVTLSENKDKACKVGTYEVIVEAKIDNGPSTSKKIKVYVVNSEPEKPVQPEQPSTPNKVYVKSNSANAQDPYNTSGTWVGGAVTGINLVIESSTPVAHFEMSKNCQDADSKISVGSGMTGEKVNNAAQVTWTEVGSNTVCFRAVNTENVKGEWSNPVKLYIDRTGPKAEFIHTWKDSKEDWHNSSSLLVEYKATDSESGLSHFEYTYDDVKAKKAEEIITYNEATGKLTVHENTEPNRPELYVYVRAVDKAGNKGEWTLNPAYTNMDTVKPETPILEVIGNNTSVVKINATFKDGVSTRPSGFGKLIYNVDEGEEKSELAQTITMPTNTTNENKASFVKVWAVDKAGNRSDNYATQNVIITPSKKPVESVELTDDGTKITDGASCTTKTIYPNGKLTLVAKPVPSDADQKDVLWSVSDANIAVIDENGVITAKKAGTTKITAKIGDKTTSCNLTVKTQVSGAGTTSKPTSEPTTVPPANTCPSGEYKDFVTARDSIHDSCKDGTPSAIYQPSSHCYKPTCVISTTTTTKKTTPPTTNATCSIANCTVCYSDGICRQCKAGYYLSDNSCKPYECANKNCKLCTQQGVCLECYAGYTNKNGACIQDTTTSACSIPNCTSCDNQGMCRACNYGYHVSGGVCVKNATSSTTKACINTQTGSCTCENNSTGRQVGGTCSGNACQCSGGYRVVSNSCKLVCK